MSKENKRNVTVDEMSVGHCATIERTLTGTVDTRAPRDSGKAVHVGLGAMRFLGAARAGDRLDIAVRVKALTRTLNR